MTPIGHQADSAELVASEDADLVARLQQHFHRLCHGGAFLNADQVLHLLGQADHSVRQNVDIGAVGDVIDQDGHIHFTVQRFVELCKGVLGAHDIEGRQHQHGISAGVFAVLAELQALADPGLQYADYQRDPLVDSFYRDVHRAEPLLHGHGGVLTGAAQKQQTMYLVGDLIVNQRSQSLFVYCAVRIKG